MIRKGRLLHLTPVGIVRSKGFDPNDDCSHGTQAASNHHQRVEINSNRRERERESVCVSVSEEEKGNISDWLRDMSD